MDAPTQAAPLQRTDPKHLPGTVIDNRYRIEAELGRGAMGVVYRATEIWLDRTVALKVIAPGAMNDSSALVGLHREAKALASIRSQHVVQVHAFGVHEGSYFFVMEYVRGRPLDGIIAEHLAHQATIPLHRTLTILTQIAEGISAVHQAGLVHRDIKPANIVIEEDTGRPVLVDFGLATPDSDGVSARLAMGTPLYMAPEQTGLMEQGAPITPRTDVYALGCTAFVMLTGRPPYRDDNPIETMRKHVRDPIPAASSIRRELSAFDRPLARALAKSPTDRFETCLELASELIAANARGPREHTTSRPPPLALPKDAPLQVLVVDVDAEFGRSVAQAVHAAFFRHKKDLRVQVAFARSGAEAVTRAEVSPPDLVLLDYDLPGLDGSDTLSQLRALPGGDRARVVVMSRAIPEEERWRFSVLGVRDFVPKPASFMTLVQCLGKVAERLMGPAQPPEEPPPRTVRGRRPTHS